ncbi:hypothetical protein SOVF_156030, partial [Spinacia oleracea]
AVWFDYAIQGCKELRRTQGLLASQYLEEVGGRRGERDVATGCCKLSVEPQRDARNLAGTRGSRH